MLIFSHRGVQHQDFTKKDSHCFCLYKIHTQNNYVEQGKSCNIISLFCVKPKVICGKKIVIKFNQNISLSSWLDWTWELYRMYIYTTRLVSKTKNIYKNLKWTFWKINPVYLSKRKKWWSGPIEFSKWIEFFVTVGTQNNYKSPKYHLISSKIFSIKNVFAIFFMRRDLLHKNQCVFPSKK